MSKCTLRAYFVIKMTATAKTGKHDAYGVVIAHESRIGQKLHSQYRQNAEYGGTDDEERRIEAFCDKEGHYNAEQNRMGDGVGKHGKLTEH